MDVIVKNMDIYRHVLVSKYDCSIRVNMTAQVTVLLEYIDLHKFSRGIGKSLPER